MEVQKLAFDEVPNYDYFRELISKMDMGLTEIKDKFFKKITDDLLTTLV